MKGKAAIKNRVITGAPLPAGTRAASCAPYPPQLSGGGTAGSNAITPEAPIASLRNTGLLSVEELRAFPGCNHYSDEEAGGIIASLTALSEIVLDTCIFGPTIDAKKE